jgi:hypothetical protein
MKLLTSLVSLCLSVHLSIRAGSTDLNGRLSTMDLLIKVACFAEKVIKIVIIKSS